MQAGVQLVFGNPLQRSSKSLIVNVLGKPPQQRYQLE